MNAPQRDPSRAGRIGPIRLAIVAATVFLSACAPTPTPTALITVESAWARPAQLMAGEADAAESDAMSAVTTAVYMTLRNAGTSADTLVGARTDAAAAIEIHESRMDDGVMRMRQVNHLAIPPQGSIELKPGSYHLMVIGVKRDLAAGDSLDVVLELAVGGDVQVRVPVRQP